MENIINSTINFVREALENDASGHDWWHIQRVYNLAKHIAIKEKANLFVVELAALLHDISDWKFNGGDALRGGVVASQWLDSLGVEKSICTQVELIINTISFKGVNVKNQASSLEAIIVQDADRLDAIGAIGIARAFAYGGNKNRQIHNPIQTPNLHNSFEEYKKNNSSTINHFHEKLLHLAKRMNTRTGQEIAIQRHSFMQQFLAQFMQEWNFNQA
jgi:uncharacterized protein